MGPFVAVHVEPSSQDPRELAALLESCSAALRQGDCDVARGTADEAPPAAASVQWLDEWHAHIAARIDAAPAGVTRDLVFSRADARLERYRSVGLAIATIVDELEVRAEEQAQAPAPPAPPPAAEPAHATEGPPRSEARAAAPAREPPPPPARPGRIVSVEIGGLLGTGLADGAPRAGVYVRASHDLPSVPVFVAASGSYAVLTSSGAPSVTWADVGLGGGARVAAGPVRLELGARVLLDHTSASAPDPTTRVPDSTGSFIPGAALDARASWPEPSPIAVTLGVDGSLLLRQVTITNAGQELGRVRAHNVGIVGGVRLNL